MRQTTGCNTIIILQGNMKWAYPTFLFLKAQSIITSDYDVALYVYRKLINKAR